jgi:hypothetical protein
MEVNNGGFNQYYFNTQGVYEEATFQAYELLGAKDYLAVFSAAAEQAIFSLDGHVDAHQQKDPAELMKRFSETYADNPLSEADSAYYRCAPEIDVLLSSFICKHADKFPEEKMSLTKRWRQLR